jgi:hypothetical protein
MLLTGRFKVKIINNKHAFISSTPDQQKGLRSNQNNQYQQSYLFSFWKTERFKVKLISSIHVFVKISKPRQCQAFLWLNDCWIVCSERFSCLITLRISGGSRNMHVLFIISIIKDAVNVGALSFYIINMINFLVLSFYTWKRQFTCGINLPILRDVDSGA